MADQKLFDIWGGSMGIGFSDPATPKIEDEDEFEMSEVVRQRFYKFIHSFIDSFRGRIMRQVGRILNRGFGGP